MGKIFKALFPAVLFFLVAVLFLPSAHAEGDVRVTNFPDTQRVKGAVSIEGTVSHSNFIRREGLLVPPSRRNEFTEILPAGILDSDGFTSVTISLQGEVKSNEFLPGTVGIMLIPDEEPILRSFREAKQIQFPIESMSILKAGDSAYFSSVQTHQRLAFTHYRIYLYNTLNRSVDANFYIFLSN